MARVGPTWLEKQTHGIVHQFHIKYLLTPPFNFHYFLSLNDWFLDERGLCRSVDWLLSCGWVLSNPDKCSPAFTEWTSLSDEGSLHSQAGYSVVRDFLCEWNMPSHSFYHWSHSYGTTAQIYSGLCMCHTHILLELSLLSSQNLSSICSIFKTYTWPLSFEYLLFFLKLWRFLQVFSNSYEEEWDSCLHSCY